MSQTLTFENYNKVNIKELTVLKNDISSAATSIPVVSTNNIAVNDPVVIGYPGSERCDLRTASAVSSPNITVAAISYDHVIDTPVRVLFGNKIRVYRAPNIDGTQPEDGDFTVIAVIDIDSDQVDTVYTDNSGGSGYWYKFTYYNLATDTQTDMSQSGAIRGGTSHQYTTINAIKQEAGFENNQFISNSTFERARLRAQSEINNELSGIYDIPFEAPVNQTIEYITTLLAAGFVLQQKFSNPASRYNEEGKNKLDEARKLLERLNKKTLDLVDANGNSVAISNSESGSASSFQMWPNTETEYSDPSIGGGDKLFSRNLRY